MELTPRSLGLYCNSGNFVILIRNCNWILSLGSFLMKFINQKYHCKGRNWLAKTKTVSWTIRFPLVCFNGKRKTNTDALIRWFHQAQPFSRHPSIVITKSLNHHYGHVKCAILATAQRLKYWFLIRLYLILILLIKNCNLNISLGSNS